MTITADNPGRINSAGRLPVTWPGVLAVLCWLLFADFMLPPQASASDADEKKMISRIEASLAQGDQATALRQALEYSEKAYGRDAPVTIRLMHRYGYSRYRAGEYREAIRVLKDTLERSSGVYGETGGEAFEINLNLARAYSRYRERWEPRLKYYDRALEILRERGEHESITYVATLVDIVINLLNSNSLTGDYTADYRDAVHVEEIADLEVSTGGEYRNHFGKPEKYLLEAVDIGARLEHQDEYISAKIAVLQARLKVLETADLAAVPGGAEGRITRSAERELYDREEERLISAIDKLALDSGANRAYLDAANRILLDIAWLDKDEERLRAMCTHGKLDSAADYPPGRLYEIMEGGMVFAPDIGISISTNIFKPNRSRGRQPRDENGNPVKRPYFKPVCADGQLMAALIHAPKVTVEEIR